MPPDLASLTEALDAAAVPVHEAVAVTEVVVLGATGRIGRQVVAEAASRGWRVRAAAREPEGIAAGERVVPWNLRLDDEVSLEAAIGGCDAVIDCLGPRRDALAEVATFAAGTRMLLDAMARAHVERLVCVSSSAVRLEGDRLGHADRIVRAFVGSRGPFALAAKQVELETIRRSDVAWTALRPPAVVAGARSGRYGLGEAAPGLAGWISRADCAVAIVDQVTATDWICRAPFLGSARDSNLVRAAA